MTEVWRKLHKHLNNLYTLPKIICYNKSRKIRLAVYTAYAKRRNARANSFEDASET